MNEKEQLIQNLNQAMPVANQMKDNYDKSEELLDKSVSVGTFTLREGGCLAKGAIIVFGYIFLLAGIAGLLSGEEGTLSCIVIGGVVVALSLAAGKKVRTLDKKREKLQQEYEQLKNDSGLAWMPYEYRTHGCIFKIAEYVNSGRADSWKEAANLLDQDLKHEEMKIVNAVSAYQGAQSGAYNGTINKW